MNDLPEWKLDEVFKLFMFLFFGIAVGGVLLDPVAGMAESWGPTWQVLVKPMLGVLTFHGIGLLWIQLFLHAHRVKWSEIYNFHPSMPGGRGILIGGGVGVALIAVSFLMNILSAEALAWFGKEVQSQEVVQLVQQHVEIPAALLFFFFSAVVLAPVVEEFLFRGVIFRFLCQLKLRKTAYAFSALLFSVMHSNSMGFVSFIILALVFAWLYEKYQSLMICVAAHMVFNGIQFLFIVAVSFQGAGEPVLPASGEAWIVGSQWMGWLKWVGGF